MTGSDHLCGPGAGKREEGRSCWSLGAVPGNQEGTFEMNLEESEGGISRHGVGRQRAEASLSLEQGGQGRACRISGS